MNAAIQLSQLNSRYFEDRVPDHEEISATLFAPFVELLDQAERYRYRLTHTIHFLSDTEYHWRSTLDFRVPKRPVDLILSPDDPLGERDRLGGESIAELLRDEMHYDLYVPILNVPSGLLSGVSLTDESGCAVPILSRDKEFALFVQYVEMLWQVAFGDGVPASETDLKAMKMVVWLDGDSNDDAYGYLVDRISDSEAVADDRGIARLRLAIESLKTGGTLCGVLQSVRPRSRRILTMTYTDARIARVREDSRLLRFSRGVKASLGLDASIVAFEAPDVLRAHSVHYEIFAPPGIGFVGGSIVDGHTWWSIVKPGNDVRPGDNPAHLYSPPALNQAQLPDCKPCLQLLLYPERNGPHGRALATSFWIFVAIGIAVLFLPIIQARGHSSEFGAGLLAVAGGISAVMIHHMEHAMAWRLLRPARWMLIWSATAALVATIMIIGVHPPPSDELPNYCNAVDGGLYDCIERIVRADPSGSEARLGTLGAYRWWIWIISVMPVLVLGYGRLFWWRSLRAGNHGSMKAEDESDGSFFLSLHEKWQKVRQWRDRRRRGIRQMGGKRDG